MSSSDCRRRSAQTQLSKWQRETPQASRGGREAVRSRWTCSRVDNSTASIATDDAPIRPPIRTPWQKWVSAYVRWNTCHPQGHAGVFDGNTLGEARIPTSLPLSRTDSTRWSDQNEHYHGTTRNTTHLNSPRCWTDGHSLLLAVFCPAKRFLTSSYPKPSRPWPGNCPEARRCGVRSSSPSGSRRRRCRGSPARTRRGPPQACPRQGAG